MDTEQKLVHSSSSSSSSSSSCSSISSYNSNKNIDVKENSTLPLCPNKLIISLERLNPTTVLEIQQRQHWNNKKSSRNSRSRSRSSSKSIMNLDDEEESDVSTDRKGSRLQGLRKRKNRKMKKENQHEEKNIRRANKINYKEKSDVSLSYSQSEEDDDSNTKGNRKTKNKSKPAMKRKLDSRSSRTGKKVKKSETESESSESDSESRTKNRVSHRSKRSAALRKKRSHSASSENVETLQNNRRRGTKEKVETKRIQKRFRPKNYKEFFKSEESDVDSDSDTKRKNVNRKAQSSKKSSKEGQDSTSSSNDENDENKNGGKKNMKTRRRNDREDSLPKSNKSDDVFDSDTKVKNRYRKTAKEQKQLTSSSDGENNKRAENEINTNPPGGSVREDSSPKSKKSDDESHTDKLHKRNKSKERKHSASSSAGESAKKEKEEKKSKKPPGRSVREDSLTKSKKSDEESHTDKSRNRNKSKERKHSTSSSDGENDKKEKDGKKNKKLPGRSTREKSSSNANNSNDDSHSDTERKTRMGNKSSKRHALSVSLSDGENPKEEKKGKKSQKSLRSNGRKDSVSKSDDDSHSETKVKNHNLKKSSKERKHSTSSSNGENDKNEKGNKNKKNLKPIDRKGSLSKSDKSDDASDSDTKVKTRNRNKAPKERKALTSSDGENGKKEKGKKSAGRSAREKSFSNSKKSDNDSDFDTKVKIRNRNKSSKVRKDSTSSSDGEVDKKEKEGNKDKRAPKKSSKRPSKSRDNGDSSEVDEFSDLKNKSKKQEKTGTKNQSSGHSSASSDDNKRIERKMKETANWLVNSKSEKGRTTRKKIMPIRKGTVSSSDSESNEPVKKKQADNSSSHSSSDPDEKTAKHREKSKRTKKTESVHSSGEKGKKLKQRSKKSTKKSESDGSHDDEVVSDKNLSDGKKDEDSKRMKRYRSISPDITKKSVEKSQDYNQNQITHDIKDVKISLERIHVSDELLERMKNRKASVSSSESKSDISIVSDNSDSDFKSDTLTRKRRHRLKSSKLEEKSERKGKTKKQKDSGSGNSDDDKSEWRRRRSDRSNKYVIKERKKKEKGKPEKRTKKITYNDDEDYTVTETAASSDDSDPDFSYGSKKKKKAIDKVPKRRRWKPNSSTEDEKHVDSDNESDREFERMLRESDREGDESDDSSKVAEKREKRKRMKCAKMIAGTSNNKKHDGHQSFCHICKKHGELVCCLSCPYSYHLACLDPPLQKIPPGSWECPRCLADPLPGKADKILSWRWAEEQNQTRARKSDKKGQELKGKRRREYFVHWAGESYWTCSWVAELQLDIHHKTLLVWYKKEQDDVEMDFEDESINFDEADPLYQRFYRFGVKPQWLNVHRIVSHRQKDEETQYLVKWRGLPYKYLSWENEDNEEIPDFKKFIDIYHEWRQVFNADSNHTTRQKDIEKPKDFEFKYINKPPKEPTTELDDEYETQPPFIDTDSGLSLHDYQLESLNWLRKSWNNDVNTILADEMGLGKTIQAIMFIYSLFKEGHSQGPFFVTAPLSTIANWEREFDLWAPDMYVVTYTGMNDERSIIRQHEFSYRTSSSSKADKTATKIRGPLKFHVLLTSYEFVSRDLECLSSIDWAVVIVDEAHRLKSNIAKFFVDLKEYSTDYKLLLTGTPLQNNVGELFNMLRYLCPRKRQKFDALEQEFDKEDVNDAQHEKRVVKLKDIIKSHMLRRVKETVLKGLPTKSEVIVKVELSPMQTKYYKFILTKNFEGLNSRSGGHWATLMAIFMDLQKCCNHPYLFSTAMMEAPVTADDVYELSALVEASGKLSLLQKMLRKLKVDGNRVLIFSHFTKMLDILEEFLTGEGHNFERIDGNITGPSRQAAIDRFNAPNSTHFVFLLSTKAGGLGINLATADTVILYDSDWNPHNDIQAFSRAHRIGQTKAVMIYRFITRNSIEERIAQVAQSKMMLNHVVLEAGKGDLKFTLNKSALDQIIRHGTQELFKEGRNVRDNFTDEAIEELLDRSKMTIEQEESVTDDAAPENNFPTAKVVSYVAKDDNNEVEVVADALTTDADYWEQLLGPRCKRVVQKIPEPLGKRVRKKINYKDTGKKITASSDSENVETEPQATAKAESDYENSEIVISDSDSSVVVEDVVIAEKPSVKKKNAKGSKNN